MRVWVLFLGRNMIIVVFHSISTNIPAGFMQTTIIIRDPLSAEVIAPICFFYHDEQLFLVFCLER